MVANVSLRDVVEALEALTDESVAYLNRDTGDLCVIGEEEARLVEDGFAPGDLPGWFIDAAAKIREVLESEDWFPLPTRFDIHE